MVQMTSRPSQNLAGVCFPTPTLTLPYILPAHEEAYIPSLFAKSALGLTDWLRR